MQRCWKGFEQMIIGVERTALPTNCSLFIGNQIVINKCLAGPGRAPSLHTTGRKILFYTDAPK